MDNMTIGEMIETYANFGKSREFYDLYKEAATVDLKIRYALTESYMQESSIDSIFEASDMWGTIKDWAIKAWEAIKRFFKNIWFHITRFFHSIFSRSDKWYKDEAAYKKIIQDSYTLAVRNTQNRRNDPMDHFEDAVLEVSKAFGFYTDKPKRISDKMPDAVVNNLSFLSKLSNHPSSKNAADFYNGTDSNKYNYSPSESKESYTDILYRVNLTINMAYDLGIGFKVDDKKVDAICQVLNEKKINDKVESIADLLNVTYMICKPPLNFQIPETFDIIIRNTEKLVSKLKGKVSAASGVDKLSVEIAKFQADFKKAIERSKNYFIDIIVDDRFIKKLDNTKKELIEALDNVKGITGASYSTDNLKNIKLELDEPDNKRRRDKIASEFSRDGVSLASSEMKSAMLDSGATELPKILEELSNRFATVSSGISLLVKTISWTNMFRLNFAKAVQRVLSNDTIASK